jgi:dihydroorotase
MPYDLILQGGEVIDPSQKLRGVHDVGIRAGKIAAVEPSLDTTGCREVIDARGHLVMPGLIDLHVHVYWGVIPLGLEPDPLCPAGGVTTMLDAGSAGCHTFPAFRRFILERARTQVLALVNVCAAGLVCASEGELMDPRYSNPDGAIRTIRQNPDLAIGVKIRAGRHIIGEGETGWRNLRDAVRAARESETWLMVHIGNSPMTIPEILAQLQPGDVLTHCFKGGLERILDPNDRVWPEVADAARRGILFDVGHGGGSFQWQVVQAALEQGLPPTTISTDLHQACIRGPVYDMPTTMSKFLMLGVPLEQVIAMSTTRPAQVLGRADDLGTLRVGTVADIAVLAREQGRFRFFDSYDQERTGSERLVAAVTVRRGEVLPGGGGTRALHAAD